MERKIIDVSFKFEDWAGKFTPEDVVSRPIVTYEKSLQEAFGGKAIGTITDYDEVTGICKGKLWVGAGFESMILGDSKSVSAVVLQV